MVQFEAGPASAKRVLFSEAALPSLSRGTGAVEGSF